jgi:hypothetical protein
MGLIISGIVIFIITLIYLVLSPDVYKLLVLSAAVIVILFGIAMEAAFKRIDD